MDHPSASSRAETFPAGLRVLVVDDDPTWLKILEKMLRKCSYEEVGPKKILDLMNVPGLTRENVASHLQKYRLYLSRLQKQNGGRALGGNMQSDLSSKNPPGNVSQHSSIDHQSSIAVQQSAAPSEYVCTTQKIHAEGIIPDIHVDDVKNIVSLQVTDSMEALDSQRFNSVSQLGVLLSFKGMVPNADHKSFEPSVSKHLPWSGVPLMQFMQYPKHDHEPYSLLEDYSLPPQSNQQHLAAADHLRTPPPVISITRDTQKDKTGLSQIKPVFMDYRSSHIKTISPIACTVDSVFVQVERGVLNTQDSGVAYENSAIQRIKDSYLNQTSNHILIPPSRELCLKGGEELALLPDDLSLCALQGIGCFDNGLNSMEIFQYNDSAPLTEVHNNSYDGLEFNYEYMYDSIIDECLFA